MTKKTLLACILVAAAVTPAYAQGPYVGVGVATAQHSYESGTQSAAKIFGGYDLTPTWGIEAGYLRMPHFKKPNAFYSPQSAGTAPVYSAESQAKVMYLAGKATMPLNDKFSFVTKLGIAHERATMTLHAPGQGLSRKVLTNELYAGIGLKYALSEKVGLTLELEHVGSTSGPDWSGRPAKVSLNASYNF